MTLIKGMSIAQYMGRSDPHKAAKLCVIRALMPYGDRGAHACANRFKALIKAKVADVEIFDQLLEDLYIPAYASNDPDAELFDPMDDIAKIIDPLRSADMVFVVTRATRGLPDAGLVRLIERIDAYRLDLAHHNPSPTFVTGHHGAAVIACGDDSADHVSGQVAMILCKLGFGIGPSAAMGLELDDTVESYQPHEDTLARMAEQLVNVIP